MTDGMRNGDLYNIVNAHTDESEVSLPRYGGVYIHDPSYETGDRYIQIASISDLEYTGGPIAPTISYGKLALEEGKDYKLIESDASEAIGTHSVTIEGIAPYKGGTTITYKINRANISNAEVSALDDVVYDGTYHEPSFEVRLNGTTLVKGTNYIVRYGSNKNVGKATVKIDGIGNYTGTIQESFNIVMTAEGQRVYDLIAALSVTSLADEPAVQTARAEYDALSDIDRESVSNVNQLEAAEDDLERIRMTMEDIRGFLTDAQKLLDETPVSTDGSELDDATKWMTQEQAEVLRSQMDGAAALVGDESATIDELDSAANNLVEAIQSLENAIDVQLGQRHVPGDPVRENEVPATCEEDGSYDLVVRCKNCGELLEDGVHHSIPALGHAWDEGVTEVEPGCETEGSVTYTCLNDSEHTRTEVVAPLGHDYKTTVVEPTWDEGGYTLHHCERCGDEYRSDETESLRVIAERAATPVTEAIDALPKTEDLALDDADAVAAARALYDALTDEQKGLVENAESLVAAEERIAELREVAEKEESAKTAAAEVDAVIESLPSVQDLTLDDRTTVENARSSYASLADDARAYVTRLDQLQAAEARIEELQAAADKEEADRQAAEAVDEAIAALPSAGELTVADVPAVTSAREAYEALTDDQKAYVEQLGQLETIEARLQELLEAVAKEEADALAAQAVDDAIAALPEVDDVTLDDEADCTVARALYDALTDDQKSLVTGLERLEAVEAVLSDLRVEAVDDAIAALPDRDVLSLDDAEAVEAARAVYDALSDAERERVQGLSALEGTEARIAELREEEDQHEADLAAARPVVAAIEALPALDELSEADAEAVKAARDAYDALSEEQQKLVDNLDTLLAAEARIADLSAHPTSVEDATVESVADQTYTGDAIEPALAVKLSGTTLELGTDYSVSYANNTNVGTATVTLTGMGKYTGIKEVSFKIVAASVKSANVSGISNKTYSGKAQTQAPTVKLGSATLKSGTDYTLSYKNNTNAGTATITITGKGNYTGTKEVSFKIAAASVKSADVSGISNKTYSGKPQTQAPTVKLGSTTLKPNTDYTLSYKSNTNVGTATVTVTGKGNYAGSLSKTFKIKPASLSGATVASIAEQGYTGSAIRPTPTVKAGSVTLKKDIDYALLYKANKAVGTATVTVTGKGNYAGTKSTTFKIVDWVGASRIPVSATAKYTLLKGGYMRVLVNNKKAASNSVVSISGATITGKKAGKTTVYLYDKSGKQLQKKTVEVFTVHAKTFEFESSVDRNYVLDIQGKSKKDGAQMIVYKRNGGNNQKYQLYLQSDGTYGIKSVNSGKWLTVESKTNKYVQQWTWKKTGNNDQRWRVTVDASNRVTFVNVKTNKCFDVQGGKTVNSAKMIVWQYNGGLNQKWKLNQK